MDGPGAHGQPPFKRRFERRKWYGGQRYHLHRIRRSRSGADRMGMEVHNCDFAFVLHTQAPLFQGGAKCLQLFQPLFGHTRIIAIRSKYPHTFKLQIIQKVTLIRKQSAVVHIRISGA